MKQKFRVLGGGQVKEILSVTNIFCEHDLPTLRPIDCYSPFRDPNKCDCFYYYFHAHPLLYFLCVLSFPYPTFHLQINTLEELWRVNPNATLFDLERPGEFMNVLFLFDKRTRDR